MIRTLQARFYQETKGLSKFIWVPLLYLKMGLEDYIIEESHILEKVTLLHLSYGFLLLWTRRKTPIEGNSWYKGVVSLILPSFSEVCKKWKRKVVGKLCSPYSEIR